MTHIQELCNRVLLLRRKIVEGTDGTFQEIWQEGDWVWAKILPLNSNEIQREGWNSLQPSHAKYKVTIRFRRGHFSRVKWEDTTLALLSSPMVCPQKRWITCFMYALGDQHE